MMTDSELSDIGLSRADLARFSTRPCRRTACGPRLTLPTDGSGTFCFWADEHCNAFRPFLRLAAAG